MRAVTIPRFGTADVLRIDDDMPRPQPGDGEVVVRVGATGVNRMDFLVRNGYPGLDLPLPHICGADIAGVVEEVGTGVNDDGPNRIVPGARVVVYPLLSCGHCRQCRAGTSHLCAGWRCVGLHEKGGYAEFVSVPAVNVFPLPASISFEEAVVVPVAGLTAHHAVHTVGQIRPGETFFVWGGAGILGSMTIQIAKAAGAVVLTSVGSDDRAKVVRGLGADHVFVRRRGKLAEWLAQLTADGIIEDGVDVVFDTIGTQTFAESFSMVGNGGRMLLSGILSGRTAELNIHQTYYHHRSLHGLFLGTRDDMNGVLSLMAAGAIRALIDSVVPLDAAVDAHKRVEAGLHAGKVVLKP